MKRHTLLNILSLAVVAMLVQLPAPLEAQTPPPALKNKPGMDCFPYELNVVSLVDNDHQMFWKQADCIRVYVRNNPFLFKYRLEFNEVSVKEDDPLNAFGGKFGLNESSVSGTGASADKTNLELPKVAEQSDALLKQGSAEVALAAREYVLDKGAQLSIVQSVQDVNQAHAFGDIAGQDKALASLGKQIQKQPLAKPALQPGFIEMQQAVAAAPATALADYGKDIGDLQGQAALINKALRLVTDEYREFGEHVAPKLSVLKGQAIALETVQKTAEQLSNEASKELACLLNGRLDESKTKIAGCLQAADAGKAASEGPTLDERLLDFARQSAELHKKLLAQSSPGSDTKAYLDQLHSIGGRVALAACTTKAKREHDFDSIRTGLIDPLEKVLTNGFSFGYQFENSAVKREGPFGDPMAVTLTLKREEVTPFASAPDNSTTAIVASSSYTCSSDTSDMFAHGADYNSFDDFFTDKPAGLPNTYTRNQNKPVSTGQAAGKATPSGASGGAKDAAKPTTTDDITTVVLQQPWFFGKARLVLSGGLTTGFLRKQEFQRSTSIAGGASQSVIGLKADSPSRLTPMLYGHTLLYSKRHDPNAWYGTFGVTANSDNKGTSPEFLLGLSRSLAQQKFFVTAGAYFGERQKLDGGLHVGDVIPSSFTGELPVTKSYHSGFAFGISYRFAATKDPQKPAAAATPTTTPAKPKPAGQ